MTDQTSKIVAFKKALNSGKSTQEIAKEFGLNEKDVAEVRTLKGEALESRITKGFFGLGG